MVSASTPLGGRKARPRLVFSGELRVRMAAEMLAELRQAAGELGISTADLVRLIVRTWLRARRAA